MRYRWRDLPAVLRTPVGRHQLALGQLHAAFPITAAVASAYRRALIARTRIVSVVGSEGKTMTARAVSVALGLGLREGIEINEKALLPFQVLRILPGRRHAVIETAIDAPGQMAVFASLIRPQICVATTIGTEHLGAFGSTDRIFEEKSRMVRALPADGLAVLNSDDPRVASFAGLTRARVVTYGLGVDADVRATEVAIGWPASTSLTLRIGGREWPARCNGIGDGVVYSVAAAVAVAVAEGVPVDMALKRLAGLPQAPGRMAVEELPSGAILIDDSHHGTVGGAFRALDDLEATPGRRRFVVLGDLQEVRSEVRETHRSVGARAGVAASRLLLVLGSGELAKCVRVGAQSAGLARSQITVATRDVAAVIERLREELGPGDFVLVRGRYYQRLARIRLALTGRSVRCALPTCRVPLLECGDCPMLERGWEGIRPVF